jgi:hypothetical protein
VTCNFVQFNHRGDIVPSGLPPRPPGLSFAEALMLNNYVGGSSALIVKTSIVRAIGGWDERISCCDWDLWRQLSFDYEIHFVDQVLVRYRRHASNRGDDMAFMLPGTVMHFGNILQDTPPRLRHMLPTAKRQFLAYLRNGFRAEGLDLRFRVEDRLIFRRQRRLLSAAARFGLVVAIGSAVGARPLAEPFWIFPGVLSVRTRNRVSQHRHKCDCSHRSSAKHVCPPRNVRPCVPAGSPGFPG